MNRRTDNTETDLEVGGAAGTLGGYVIQLAKAAAQVDQIVPAAKENAAEAHRRMEAGGVRGRLVLEFGDLPQASIDSV